MKRPKLARKGKPGLSREHKIGTQTIEHFIAITTIYIRVQDIRVKINNIHQIFKLQSSRKRIHNTTERDTRIQSFPNIAPAINPGSCENNISKTKTTSCPCGKYGHPEFR